MVYHVTDFDTLRADDDDLARLRDEIRAFLTDDATRFGWQPEVDCWLSRWDADFSMRLAQAGFVGLTIPTEYGGQGRSHLHRYVVTEELLAAGAPVAAHWIADRQVAPALLTYGNEEQRRRLLPRIASGTLYSAIGMSEHGAGSDLAAVSTKATRTDAGWLLNGAKVWTSGAHLAHQMVVLARTSPLDPAHRHAGFSQFIVPTDTPGVTVEPIVQCNGEHHFNEVMFDDVALTDADLLGEVGNGWHQVTSELGFERSGPERFLSTATLIFTAITALRDTADPAVGDLLAKLISLRQLSVSVARDLSAGLDAAGRAALVKDLGTGFEQNSVELVAELVDRHSDRLDDNALRTLRAMLDIAWVHAPLFTLRGGTNEILRGIVAKGATKDSSKSSAKSAGPQLFSEDQRELYQVADDIASRATHSPGRPAAFDDGLWHTLQASGLTQLTDAEGAGPGAAATVLYALARHGAEVPLAETDVLARWLARTAGLPAPDSGPLTVAVSDGSSAAATDVPWPRCGPVLLATRGPDALRVRLLPSPEVTDEHHNLAGEPRGTIRFDAAESITARVPFTVVDELQTRGAWARCIQIVAAFDAAAALTVSHIGARVQFGRPLAALQAVQHALASMLGEIECARAATTLAVTAADRYGFADDRTRYAVTAAKVTVGRAVTPVTTIAHQLHGAIGTTAEHPLWRATLRARSWVGEFGSITTHAGVLAGYLTEYDPWDVTVGRIGPAL